MTAKKASEILDDLKNSPNMIKHALACEHTMAALFDYFEKEGRKPELDKNSWEIVGLLHDADYEATDKSLDRHTDLTSEKLGKAGVDQLIIDAIRGHCDKAERTTTMAKSVYAADELTGLIVACALVKPDKKLRSVGVKSVLKKFKEKSFTANVNRDQIKSCEDQLNIPLEEFIGITLKAMQDYSDELGL